MNGDSDADGDGDSDGTDFLAWQRQFGSGAGAITTQQAVPEPGVLYSALHYCPAIHHPSRGAVV